VATYYDIFGQKVQYVTSDPSDVVEGQVWYNSTSNTGKVQAYNAAVAWSTGGTMNTARGGFYGGAGAGVNDGLIGGSNPTAVEQYNGTSWTTKTSPSDSTTQRTWWGDSSSAAGQVMGYPCNTRVQYGDGFGIQTAGVKVGGGQPPGNPNAPNSTELYDGTSFTISPGQLNNARGGGAASGLTNANAFYAGGGAAPLQDTTEEWAGIGEATKTITTS